MKNNKFVNIIVSKFTILSLQILASVILMYFIIKLNFIPAKYLSMVIGGLCGVWILLAGIIYWGSKKSEHSKRVLFSKIISVLTSIMIVAATSYIVRGDNFINNISEKTTETHVVSVRVLKGSPIASLSDLSGKKNAVSYQHDSVNIAEAIAHFETEIGTDLNIEKKDNYTELAQTLYNKEVDAIIVGGEYIDLIEESFEHFDAETVEIAKYKINKEMKQTYKATDVTEKPFTVFLTGNDTFGEISTVSRSDVNLLVTVNPKTKQILMISIPRDTEITLATAGKKDKLTHTGIYGTEETIATIENFLEVDINYYARTNFDGIQYIVDELGGVDIDSPHEDFETLHGGYTITKGMNHMDGDKALCFVRERKSFLGGDFVRGQNQQLLLKAMLEKAMSPKIITNFSGILSAIEGTFETNMPSDDIRALLGMQMNDMASWEMFNVQITGTPYLGKTYSMPTEDVSITEPDANSVEAIQGLINKIEKGQKLTQEDTKNYTGEEGE